MSGTFEGTRGYAQRRSTVSLFYSWMSRGKNAKCHLLYFKIICIFLLFSEIQDQSEREQT